MKHRKHTPPRRPTPLELAVDFPILFLLLAGALWSFLTAAQIQPEVPLLLGGCALLALVYILMCALPGRWLAAAMAAAMAAIGIAVWQLWETLRLGEIILRCGVVNTVSTSLELDHFIVPIQDLPEGVWLHAATVLALVTGAVLGLPLALLVVRGRRFLPVLILTLPFVALPLCISVTPAWGPLLMLLLAWCVLGLTALPRRQDPRGATRLTLAVLPLTALVLVGLTWAMPQSSYQRPQWADHALDSLNNWVTHLDIQLFDGRGPFGFGSGGSFTDADGKVDLSDAGPLRFSGRTVLEVDTDLRGRIYLRGFSGAQYDGTGWLPLEDSDYSAMFLDPDSEGIPPYSYSSVYFPSLEGWQPMNFPALAQRNSFPGSSYAKVTIRNIGADPGYVYTPYHILSKPDELSGAKFVNDAYLARGEDVWTHTLYVQPGCNPLSMAQIPDEAEEALWTYENFVYSYYTSVPEDCAQALDETLRGINDFLLANPDNEACQEYLHLVSPESVQDHRQFQRQYPLTIAKVVVAYLEEIAEYDPDTPLTPEGEEFVSYFLTESHRGYCMHFASAAALLLRYINVPTRYVTGYVADVPASGHVKVPDSAAHAWIEVYIPGYGWEPVEVTPAYAGGTPGQTATAEPTPTPTAAPTPTATQTPQASAAPTPTPSQAPGADEPRQKPLDLRLVVIPLVVVLILLAFPLARNLVRRRREKKLKGPDTNQAVIYAYLYLKKLERWGGQVPEEVFALAKKARFSPHTLTEAERAVAVDAAHAIWAQVDQSLPWYRRLACRYLLFLC